MKKRLHGHLGNALIGNEEIAAVNRVLENQDIFRFNAESINSSLVEQEIAAELRVPNVRLIANATCALRAGILALRPKPGDFVIIPGITFIATANAVLSSGLIPIIVDVDETGHMRPDSLAESLARFEGLVIAVIGVHLDGSSAKISAIRDLCVKFGVHLIEDTAQSYGVTHNGQYLGTFGSLGCFSFQQNKILSTGEGGALVGTHDELFDRACRFADHGAHRFIDGMPYWNNDSFFGENYKSTNLMAEMLRVQVLKLQSVREVVSQRYNEIISFLPTGSFVPRGQEDIPLSVWVEDRGLIARLEEIGVELKSWWSWCMPSHPIIQNKLSPYANGFPWNLNSHVTIDAPEAERICRQRKSINVSLDHEYHSDILMSLRRV